MLSAVAQIGITSQVTEGLFGSWGCDEAHVIRKCKGRMHAVSEGHQNDRRGRCSDIPHPTLVSLTSGLSVLKTERHDNREVFVLTQEGARSVVLYYCLFLSPLSDKILIHISTQMSLFEQPVY